MGFIGDAFDRYTDWMMEGSEAWSLTKTFGSAAAALIIVAGAVIAPLAMIANNNAEAAAKDYATLDARPAQVEIYRSVQDCTVKLRDGTSCQISFDKAVHQSKDLGTYLSYGSRVNCEAAHGNCTEHVTTTQVIIGYNKIGDVSIPIYMPVTSYSYTPHMVGWQTLNDNPQVSVPLYNTPAPNIAVRADGATFNLS
ncbi:MAG TPA: DUF1190 domain-containing protein [Alphaproteobacteria bacterium]